MMEADIKENNCRDTGCKAIASKRQHESTLSCKTSQSRNEICVGCSYKNNDLCQKMEGTKIPGELEQKGLTERTYRGYRHECYGCMPMRNQSHNHSENHYREIEKKSRKT